VTATENTLLEALDALTHPVVSKVIQDGPIGSGLAGQHTVTITLPSLLEQLDEAIRATIGIGGSGSIAHQRNMLNNDALHRFMIISSTIKDWARMVGVEVRPDSQPGPTLRKWYVAYTARPAGTDPERFYEHQMKGWATQIEAMFDPFRIRTLPNSCPVCAATEWISDEDGLKYLRPLIIQFKPDGPDMIQRAKGLCRACLQVWSVRELAYAIEHPHVQEPTG
jgi:hypothetical protein